MTRKKRKQPYAEVPARSKRRDSNTPAAETAAPYQQRRRSAPISATPKCRNYYIGWRPARNDKTLEAPAHVGSGEILSADWLWRSHIAIRRPAIIPMQSTDVSLQRSSNCWTLDSLIQEAGDIKVKVEKQLKPKDGFGKGHKVDMTFGSFLEELKAGNEHLYLTTQEAVTDKSEFESPWRGPLSNLATDARRKPNIMGNLILESANMWIGSSSEGSSSGLHHDYHDNLYILLHGQKEFRLWSPAEAENMYTYGKLQNVHANGRIVYEGQGEVLADGSNRADVKQFEIRRAQPLFEADAAKSNEKKRKSRPLQGNRTDGYFSSDSDIWNGMDDYDDLESQSSETGLASLEDDPPSFSRVDLRASCAQIKSEFPDFPGLSSAMTCKLKAGDMLYLPAGWFHDVTSQNEQGKDKGAWHMAINYWFHPPDNLKPTAFQNPYTSAFWPAKSKCSS